MSSLQLWNSLTSNSESIVINIHFPKVETIWAILNQGKVMWTINRFKQAGGCLNNNLEFNAKCKNTHIDDKWSNIFLFQRWWYKESKNTDAWFMQKELCAPRQIWLFCLFLTTKFDWKKIKDYWKQLDRIKRTAKFSFGVYVLLLSRKE